MPVLSRSGKCNEKNLYHLSRANWGGILVLETALIPAPISYIHVFAVENLVVGLLVGAIGLTLCVVNHIVSRHPWVDYICL